MAGGRAPELSDEEDRAWDKEAPQDLCMHCVSRHKSLQACCKSDSFKSPGAPVKSVLTLSLECLCLGNSVHIESNIFFLLILVAFI